MTEFGIALWNLTCKYSLAYYLCMSDVYKALAEPARRAILDELIERDDQTLFEICGRLATKHDFAMSRQAISQHLQILEDADLVRTRRQGRYKYHSINTEPIETSMKRWRRPESGTPANPSESEGEPG